MSTRATYQFSEQHGPRTTVYIHYDGYPAGAACYFRSMLDYPNRRGNNATRFIRANDKAEVTESHEIHGDTEYRYNLDDDGRLRAFKAVGPWNQQHWEEIYSGPLERFIEQNGGGHWN